MLLQIQIFPAIESTSSYTTTAQQGIQVPAQQSIVPAVTRYINTGYPFTTTSTTTDTTTAAATKASKNDDTQQLIWSMGRKQGNYHITTDRSVSREHLKLFNMVSTTGITTTTTAQETDTTTKKKKDCCIRIQNVGKLLSSLVIEEIITDEPTTDSTDPRHQEDDDIKDDSSDTTVDESHISRHQNINRNCSKYHAPHTSQHQRSSQQSIQDDVDLSTITKHLTQRALSNTVGSNRHYSVRLQSMGVDETIAIGFSDTTGTDGSNPKCLATKQYGDDDSYDWYSHPKRIIIQCGKLGTTLVLRRVSLRFVASRLPMKQFLSDTQWNIEHTLGGTVQESFDVPTDVVTTNNNYTKGYQSKDDAEDDSNTNPTYLISSEYHGSPKHLIAWCRNIPIVRPTFVTTLIQQYQQHYFASSPIFASSLGDNSNDETSSPIPSIHMIKDHKLTAPKEYQFFEHVPDPYLWQNCTLLSPLQSIVDAIDHVTSNTTTTDATTHDRNEKELNELVQAAGAKVILIQSLLEDDTNRDDNRIDQQSKLDEAALRRLFNVALVHHPTSVSYFMLDTTLLKNQYPVVVKLLQEQHGVPIFTPKEIAVAITQQSDLRDRIGTFHHLQLSSGKQKHSQKEGGNDEASSKAAHDSNAMEQPNTTDDAIADTPPVRTRSKRLAKKGTTTTTTTPVQENRTLSKNNRSTLQTSARRRRQAIAPNDDEYKVWNGIAKESTGDDDSFPMNTHDSPLATEALDVTDMNTDDATAVAAPGQSSRNLEDVDPSPITTSKRKPVSTEGWLTALKQGPQRQRIYDEKVQIHAKLCQSEDAAKDGTNVICVIPALTQLVKGLVSKPHQEMQQVQNYRSISGRAGSDYKAFRKNSVPLTLKRTVVNLQPCHVTKTRNTSLDDNDVQRRQVEAQQRRADELFR
jgi:hypothetical protein